MAFQSRYLFKKVQYYKGENYHVPFLIETNPIDNSGQDGGSESFKLCLSLVHSHLDLVGMDDRVVNELTNQSKV